MVSVCHSLVSSIAPCWQRPNGCRKPDTVGSDMKGGPRREFDLNRLLRCESRQRNLTSFLWFGCPPACTGIQIPNVHILATPQSSSRQRGVSTSVSQSNHLISITYHHGHATSMRGNRSHWQKALHDCGWMWCAGKTRAVISSKHTRKRRRAWWVLLKPTPRFSPSSLLWISGGTTLVCSLTYSRRTASRLESAPRLGEGAER